MTSSCLHLLFINRSFDFKKSTALFRRRLSSPFKARAGRTALPTVGLSDRAEVDSLRAFEAFSGFFGLFGIVLAIFLTVR